MRLGDNIRRLCAVLALTLMIGMLSACTVVNLDDGTILFGGKESEEEAGASVFDEEFDPDQYVSEIWESQALPVFLDSAAEFSTVYEAISKDFDAACETYGILSNDKGSWVFIVKGTASVSEVNRESRNGIAALLVDETAVQLQIGPVYKGASLRDALPFIKFSDFKNQVAFSSISSALNRYVDETIITASGIDDAAGKQISFVGAFSIKAAADDIMITPVEIQVGE